MGGCLQEKEQPHAVKLYAKKEVKPGCLWACGCGCGCG